MMIECDGVPIYFQRRRLREMCENKSLLTTRKVIFDMTYDMYLKVEKGERNIFLVRIHSSVYLLFVVPERICVTKIVLFVQLE